MPDNVHMLASIPQRLRSASFVDYWNGKSTLMMCDKHVNPKYKFWDWHFWSKGYHVSTLVPKLG
nr:transposase [Streptococcus thoraltensis]